MIEEPSFGPELFAFLAELRANNDRDWFAANKPRYVEAVQEPSLAFIEDVGHLMPELSEHFHGSLYRIYRDTRFSRDKTPYKTHAGIHFRHERHRDAHAPGFYLHMEPGHVFMGCGTWRPESAALRAIRDAIAAHPHRWDAATEGLELTGETLKRPPAGFDPDHPRIEDLKRKSFVAVVALDEATVTAPGFLDRWMELCRAGAPFMRFLCDALRVPF